MQTDEDLQAQQDLKEGARRKLEEDRGKIALIEKVDSRARRHVRRPYYEEFQTGDQGVRHYNPRSLSKFARFRSLSDVLILCAYVELFLVATGVGLVVYLKLSGVIPNLAVLFTLIVIWLVVGGGLYFAFKFLGELAYLLSDVGDQQNDIVQLLLDVRENTNKPQDETEESAG